METSGSPVVDPAGKLLGYRGADMRGPGGLFQNLETFGLAADNVLYQFSFLHFAVIYRTGILNQKLCASHIQTGWGAGQGSRGRRSRSPRSDWGVTGTGGL